MGSSFSFLYLFSLKKLMLFLLLQFVGIIITVSSPSNQPMCSDDESSALLQFKQSFLIDEHDFGDSKISSWKLEESGSDCCSWDGVECDENTGHVIGLDLSGSFLHGSINSSSSLFRLAHLQTLNLAYNNFAYSQIPRAIGHLSSLSYLNLSSASFSGHIPLEMAALSNLTSLDLSLNVDSSDNNLLSIESQTLNNNLLNIEPQTLNYNLLSIESQTLNNNLLSIESQTLNSLLHNLTSLKVLHLSQVNISSKVHPILANLSSLTSLDLRDCELEGEFPLAIFQLPNLLSLNVMFNPYLTGHLPEFNKSSPLMSLKVANTSFSGDLPETIGNLRSLNSLDIRSCNFSGSIPSSLGNLTQLEYLFLSRNNFRSETLANLQWLGKKTKLTHLGLSKISLNGSIPSFLQNLTRLVSLNLKFNQLTGEIPSWIGNLTQLSELGLCYNFLKGPIPPSIFGLLNLQALSLQDNKLSGVVKPEMFLRLRYLTELQLSCNNLSLLTSNNSMNNATFLPKLKILGLAECNISEFPDFLRYQDELQFLALSDNGILGRIPKWFWSVSMKTLSVILLDRNFLTGFVQPPAVLLWTSLHVLFLGSNELQGSLPIPPPSILVYGAESNALTGEISPLFCNVTSLKVLNLAYNNLSGALPQCLGNFNGSLTILDLRNNKFHGTIPHLCSKGNSLRMIDLNQNQLQGLVPRSLAKCTNLELFNIGNNHVIDSFPSWLGTLPELKVLILRSNNFYGEIEGSETNFDFPKLRIIDLSYNDFSGKLPSNYFQSWNAMKAVNVSQLTYMRYTRIYYIYGFEYTSTTTYAYSMKITNKGLLAVYYRIPEFFTAVDLSSNRFEGDIPDSIGNLQGLQLLNLSNNILTGQIPSCLGNLTEVEGLDLSQNKLSGEIPSQLAGMTFLVVLNVSHNQLSGLIPQGQQFDTFDNTSFEGNLRLCGSPLSKKCGSFLVPPPTSTSDEDEDFKFPSGYDWIFIVAGYGSGLVVGLILGRIWTTRKHEWFMETFGRRTQKRQREKQRKRRN